jgi:hypothetical protein
MRKCLSRKSLSCKRHSRWDFGNVRMTLTSPWISWTMYLIYEHTPTAREVERSDQEGL